MPPNAVKRKNPSVSQSFHLHKILKEKRKGFIKNHILTMRQPHSRIICLPCNDEVACSGEHLDVSARRIFGLENCVGVCVGSGAGGEDEEVVAVEVDGVFVMMVDG